LPVFNGETGIRRAIVSILSQNFTDLELIVVDNASTDSSPQVCAEYAQADPRVRFHRNPRNIGAGPNHNLCLEMARGKYFTWAAHDVEWLPGMLRRCHEVIETGPSNVALVYPRCLMVDASGSAARSIAETPSIECRHSPPHKRVTTVIERVMWVNQLFGLMRTEVLRQTRGIDSFASSDYVLLAELALLGEIWEIPEVLVRRYLAPDRGTTAHHGNRAAWANWLNPSVKSNLGVLSHNQRLLVEYMRSAVQLPEHPMDRLRCTYAVASTQARRTLRPRVRLLRRLFTRRGLSAT
jgi:glycosyltransferase involved in cell wall biosynthesis